MAQDTGGPGPEGCRTNAECADSASEFGMVCASPHDPNACGIPPMDVCENNAQCVGMGPAGLDLICHAYEDSCSPDGIGSNCDESCVKYPTLCGDGGLLVCGPNGACEPRSCVDGFTCHAVQFCALGAPGADPHGCNFVTCQADADCDDGLFCVKGKCIETLGTCVEDMPVP